MEPCVTPLSYLPGHMVSAPFIFFQAEDGIRDDLVTGVQTCALPICGILNSTRARPGLRPIALSTPANGSLRMPNPAKDQKREEKVLAKLPEICLGLPQAREVKTWRPTCRRSRVTKRRGAKARRQCRQGIWKCIRLSRTNREISGGSIV